MRRIRLLRFLLLALLLPFVVVLVVMLRPPSTGHTPQPAMQQTGESAESVEYIDIVQGMRKLLFQAGRLEADADGNYHFEDIRQLKVFREDASPVIVRADFGSLSGAEGRRLVTLEGGVEFKDEVEGLVLSVPALEVDVAAGEARSLGGVDFRGPQYNGRAVSVTYGLRDRPTVLREPEMTAADGSTLQAEQATLLDGTRDVEFDGGVRIFDAESVFHADRMRVWRREDRLERLVASGSVQGRTASPEGPPGELRAARAELGWDEQGEPSLLSLEGDAWIRRGSNDLSARTLEARRHPDSTDWQFTARGDVHAASDLESGPASLRADELDGVVDAEGRLLSGEASGLVRFESGDTVGEAARATFDPARTGRELALVSSAQRRARLARERSRVAAERIFTDPSGTSLLAEVRVEASLLPAPDGDAGDGLFRSDRATHFVAERLEGDPKSNRLVFTGNVRGWQDERNLSAERVHIDETGERLVASGRVTTRMPRVRTRAALSEADFVQVSADELDYRGQDRVAVYRGRVRVRQSEGFMEADELTVEISEGGGGISTMLAAGNVGFEFRAPDSEGVPRPVTGSGDRLVYRPGEAVLTLYGDNAPAAVERSGDGGGTTTGRVLRYHLGTGALEVESGGGGKAKIRTSEG